MVSHAFAALVKKRADLAGKEKGFTLIELLVTVIIIGVLAAIAIPVYLNVQGGAKDSAVKSDLTNAKVAISASQTNTANGDLPVDDLAFKVISPAPPTDNYDPEKILTYTKTTTTTGAGTTESPTVTTIGYCISGQSASGKWFAITDKLSVASGQGCNTAGTVTKADNAA